MPILKVMFWVEPSRSHRWTGCLPALSRRPHLCIGGVGAIIQHWGCGYMMHSCSIVPWPPDVLRLTRIARGGHTRHENTATSQCSNEQNGVGSDVCDST